MPVTGIVVTCVEGCSGEVAERIATFDGVEVHGILPDGEVVAVIEAETVAAEVELVSRLNDVEGVVSVRLAYHKFDDVA